MMTRSTSSSVKRCLVARSARGSRAAAARRDKRTRRRNGRGPLIEPLRRRPGVCPPTVGDCFVGKIWPHVRRRPLAHLAAPQRRLNRARELVSGRDRRTTAPRRPPAAAPIPAGSPVRPNPSWRGPFLSCVRSRPEVAAAHSSETLSGRPAGSARWRTADCGLRTAASSLAATLRRGERNLNWQRN